MSLPNPASEAAATRKVDYDRGVVFADDPATNLTVHEYADKPGYYFTHQLTPVPEEIARRALGDLHVTKALRQRTINESMDAHYAKIQIELEQAADTAKVVTERNGYILKDIGLERYVIEVEGQRLVKEPLPKDIAQSLFDKLAPPPVAPEVEVEATPIKVKSLASK